ncbi:MAG: hypothetical protein QNJ88_16580 [Acidimicrobiia bacterium]|nr:hypothetical protein [Acidimicrobiia bacterium]
MITELPLATVLGPEFDTEEAQAWLAGWADQWMGLEPAAGRGWHSNGTDLIGGSLLWETVSDWLEIDIEIRRHPKGILRDSRPPDPVWTVTLVLMVGCWCQDNHNAHYIEERRWDVGSVEALTDRTRSAYTVAQGWLESSMDADYWRHRARLQPRPGSTIAEQ